MPETSSNAPRTLRELLGDQQPQADDPIMHTTMHSALRRVRMPDGPLSDMIAWLHRKVTQHQDNSRRWYHEQTGGVPSLAQAQAMLRRSRRRKKRELTPEEKRARTALYMRTYRAKIRREKKHMEEMAASGELERRGELKHWKEQKKWYRRNRRRLKKEGKWTGLPPKPEGLTKPKKPTA